MYQHKEKLSREYILNNVLQEAIFEKYLGVTPDTAARFNNPLREDDYPDCRFYVDKRNMIKFHDFAMGWNWDCFNLVQHLFSCSFGKSLEVIAQDFGLREGQVTQAVKVSELLESHKNRTKVSYKVTRGTWSERALEYWKRYDLGEDILVQYAVSPVDVLWIDRGSGVERLYSWNPNDPCFVYHFGGYNYKFYFPLRDKRGIKPRFIEALTQKGIIQGWNKLPKTGDVVVITKSYKDVISLGNYDIPAVAPQGESVIINPKLITNLKNRFANVVSLMDYDLAGVKAANRLKKSGIPYFFFTNGKLKTEDFGAKDFSDFVEKYGKNETIDLIEYVRNKI